MTVLSRFFAVLVLGAIAGILATLRIQADPPRLPGLPFDIPSLQASPETAPDPAPPVFASADPRLAGRNAQLNSDAVIAVYEQVSPAVVNINFTARSRDQFGRSVVQQGTGSGFIISNQGHIATNHHVAGEASRLDVTLANGDSYVGELTGVDMANDLAIVKLQAPANVLASLPVVPLGDSNQVRVGETVVAIGNPFGLERSASMGIVSSLARTRPGENERLIANMIQTDAAINPGNSGGPLLNLNGEVIGINEQIETQGQGNIGIGFAVPVNALRRYMPDMLAGRTPQHAWFGISGGRLTPTLAEQFNLDIKQGVVVASTIRGGPAERAGLRGSNSNNLASADIITSIDGRAIRTVEDIIRYVDEKNPGDTVRVSFTRGGRSQTVDVQLGVWPAAGTPLS
jgi:S1-C subfamily serine protease